MQFHPTIGRHPFTFSDDTDDSGILSFCPFELIQGQTDSGRVGCDHYLAQVFLTQLLFQRLDVGRRQKSACNQKEINRAANEDGGRNWREIEKTDGMPGLLAKEL